MTEPKPVALPLGYIPIQFFGLSSANPLPKHWQTLSRKFFRTKAGKLFFFGRKKGIEGRTASTHGNRRRSPIPELLLECCKKRVRTHDRQLKVIIEIPGYFSELLSAIILTKKKEEPTCK